MSNNITITYKTIAVISIIINIILITAFFLFTPSNTANVALGEELEETQIPESETPEEPQPEPQEPEIPPELQAKITEYTELAQAFFLESPTYSFDGIPPVEFNLIDLQENEMKFLFRFNSAHPGYGNRADAPVPEEQTYHEMEVIVRNGEVVSAVTDRKYDEINRQYSLFGEIEESIQ